LIGAGWIAREQVEAAFWEVANERGFDPKVVRDVVEAPLPAVPGHPPAPLRDVSQVTFVLISEAQRQMIIREGN